MGNLDGGEATLLKQAPQDFDASGYQVSQHFARSKDGTRVPYFQIAAKDLKPDGSTPTLLYGYGGFEVPLLPGYLGGKAPAWLERGGVYVVANIRGGGEYGPAWHQAALKQNRHRAYEDFAAVAEDLITRKVTSAPHLGARRQQRRPVGGQYADAVSAAVRLHRLRSAAAGHAALYPAFRRRVVDRRIR